ncbi:MAG: 4-diphosphocytidyl-2C-methyl-D-erythritol kinase [Synergistaceae bacterium]|jgi:4-diphosphocytidyl-2-C-methyl-D-erythritol kinase|nr:4-diphosphocytidyl-2C-methyl-D-erythritol kinase [Synergistaceae bacterium]
MLFTETCSIKINLTLRVLGAREDGYHDIYSLFWRLRSPEALEISVPSPDDELRVTGADIPGENILSRVQRHIRGVCGDGSFPGVSMRLHKLLPVGSGVGAGSGNAAALLRWFGRVRHATSLGGDVPGMASLGADVAFLASGRDLALAHGVGDLLDGLDGSLPLSAVICFPEWASYTARAYASLDAYRRARGMGPPMDEVRSRVEALSVLNSLRNENKLGILPNDFISCLSEYESCYNTLYEVFDKNGSIAWGLCGSGSACFALFRRKDAGFAIPGLTEALSREESSRFQWLRQILVVE